MSPKKSTEEAKQNHSIFQLVTLVTWKIKKNWKKVHSIDIFVDDRIREIVHCIAVHCIESLIRQIVGFSIKSKICVDFWQNLHPEAQKLTSKSSLELDWSGKYLFIRIKSRKKTNFFYFFKWTDESMMLEEEKS